MVQREVVQQLEGLHAGMRGGDVNRLGNVTLFERCEYIDMVGARCEEMSVKSKQQRAPPTGPLPSGWGGAVGGGRRERHLVMEVLFELESGELDTRFPIERTLKDALGGHGEPFHHRTGQQVLHSEAHMHT